MEMRKDNINVDLKREEYSVGAENMCSLVADPYSFHKRLKKFAWPDIKTNGSKRQENEEYPLIHFLYFPPVLLFPWFNKNTIKIMLFLKE